MKTFSAKAETTDRKWYVIDAQNQVVGRVAEKAAVLLRGKDKAIFTPHVDTGDHVIIINAEKAKFTGKKEEQKNYSSYSNFIGGQKNESPKEVRRRKPELIVERAVKGMIPHNRLGRVVLKKLHVYAGAEHPHAAQEPKAIKVTR
ncbi:MAG: 50S ribosomal protein L13 [Verrucomicrobiales bacterium]|jgi:large subunit ribosomal protein L13|nr:50S ribosomal protein L13 [Verrucomicrobiales bacterium]